MFYVKSQLDESTTLLTEITDENVFTRCPDCGQEVAVDLNDIVDDEGQLDLFGVGVCCTECSRKRWNAAGMGVKPNSAKHVEGV